MKQSALGARIREVRGERNLSLRELARRAGLSPSYLSEIESGQRLPSETMLDALADELGVEPEVFRDLHAGKIMVMLKGLLESDPAWVRALGRITEAASQGKLAPGVVSKWIDRI